MEKMHTIKHKSVENTKSNINGSTTKASDSYLSQLTQPRFRATPVLEESKTPDLICLSHLRWDFVYQRPQHLLSRAAKERRVFFVEEPIFGDSGPRLDINPRDSGVWVVVPHLPHGLNETEAIATQQA